MKYCGIPQEPDGNMLGYSIWKFHTFNGLDNFIRKTIE